MYANFQAGSLTLLASDTHPGVDLKRGNNISLSMHFSDVESIDKTFDAFSEGATITMHLQDTFWGARFGMLTDKFGINWMFNHDYPKKPE
jgi:PhnB protein